MVEVNEQSRPLAEGVKAGFADGAFRAFSPDSPVNAAAKRADGAARPFLTQQGALLRVQAFGPGLILNAV